MSVGNELPLCGVADAVEHVDPEGRSRLLCLRSERQQMPLASGDRDIEAELGWLDTNLRGQTLCANLIEQPEIMIADGGGFARVRYCFPELSVEQTATSSGDGRACLQGVFRTFTRHELPGSALNERAVESEVVETFTSRCSEENRATEGQLLELFENLFRFFRVVAGDRQLDQIVG